MKSMKVRSVMKSVKVKSTLKSTKTKSAATTHNTKNIAPTKTFKTSERDRVYARGYHRKIEELKRVGGCNPEQAKELARAAGKALLMQSGFPLFR